MIKIEETQVFNIEGAFRGMRNPMNSWYLSDSYVDEETRKFIVLNGGKDATLAKKLYDGGQPHRKFLRQIFVSCDIIAPLYWWKQFDTYKVGTTANSTSTMHKGVHFYTLDDFSTEYIREEDIPFLKRYIEVINDVVKRHSYTDDQKEKEQLFRELIQLLPSSLNQLRTVTMDYENIVNMYEWRYYHKLQEWRDLCSWAESLPYMDLFLVHAT